MTRRELVRGLSVCAVAGPALADAQMLGRLFGRRPRKAQPVAAPLVLVGGKDIRSFRFDPAKGQLASAEVAATTANPSFFALGPVRNGQQMVYVGNEGSDEGSSGLSTWVLDRGRGTLRQVGKVSSGFAGPCYVSVDATGQSVYAACYGGSGVSSYRVLPDGLLSNPVDRVNFRKAAFGRQGPSRERQEAPHPHSATISPDNRFLVVNDLGNDEIVLFAIHPDTAQLGEPLLFTNHRPGSGPRHVAFHPNGRWLYGITELDSKIDLYLWLETHGKPPQALLTDTDRTVSTLAAGYSGGNTAAEIMVGPNGYHVYASNRGEDSLVMFAVDQDTGALSVRQRISCGGKKPRQFTLDPSGRWLLCGNQESGTVTVFARNGGTGELTGPVQTVAVDAVTFTLFV